MQAGPGPCAAPGRMPAAPGPTQGPAVPMALRLAWRAAPHLLRGLHRTLLSPPRPRSSLGRRHFAPRSPGASAAFSAPDVALPPADAVPLPGGLYVVATPIGNLEDISYRALRVLRYSSLILAEDTRHTRKLLTFFGIATPLLSCNEHKEHERTAQARWPWHLFPSG